MTEESNSMKKVTNLSAFEMADSFQVELSELVTSIENQIRALNPLLHLIKTVTYLLKMLKRS